MTREGWPDTIPTFHPIRRIGHAILEFFSMHQLSTHGDHFINPLDEPIDPVTEFDRVFSGGMQPDAALDIPPRIPFS